MNPVPARRVVRVSAALAALVLLVASTSVADVRWRDGSILVARPMNGVELSAELAKLTARDGKQRFIVHTDGPLQLKQREALAGRGLVLLDYLGDSAWFARLAPGADPVRLSETPGLLRIDQLEATRKMHPDLVAGVIRPWTIVSEPGKDDEKRAARGERPANPTIALIVLMHADVDSTREAESILARHGGKVVSTFHSINGVLAHVAADRAAALAAEDSVMYVEPPLPALTAVNDSNRPRVGVDVLEQPPYGLDGSGVTVLVYDSGQMFAHGDFAGRLTIGPSDTSGISDHSTHVGGTIGGDGSGSAGQYRGMAPGVDIVSYGFEQEGGLQQGFLYTDPGDIEADYTEAITVLGAEIANNSIGTNTAPNGYPCEWEGNYGATGALIDAIVAGSTGNPFRIVWANGNERGSGACGSTYVTTAPPACAKNHITAGAMNSDDDSVTSFTSWGPCDDGRIKPDVSGPGCQSGGDGGVTSTSSAGSYNTKCGTSMAAPTITGISALLMQQYRQTFPGEPLFRNATLKAILATTAEDIEATGPDFKTGYGSVRGVPAADLVAEGRFLEAEVAQSEVYTFLVLVDPDDTEVRVTISWDDPPGTPNVNPVLVNDLDLRIIGPGNVTHFPWTLDPQNPANPAVRTQRDGVNNIEQVVIDNPAPGAYQIEVVGFNVAVGATQAFGAAASPSLVNCSSAGTLRGDRGRITCQGDLGLQVIDCDLNTDDGLTEIVVVAAVSTSEPGGESVTLTETAPESAAFLGSLPIDTSDAAGTLQVAEGETITVTYIDADDGDGGFNVPIGTEIVVDCTAPLITGVTVTEIEPRDATVGVDLDEDARVTIHHGLVCGAPTDSTTSFALTTQHSVGLAGLLDDTTYFFTVEAEDEAGNGVAADNGGACYSFTTPEVPDFLTEQFGAGLDLAGTTATFAPNGTIDFYEFCNEPLAGGLPTDPTGGTVLGLSDDQPQSINLSGGAEVLLYGTGWNEIWVGPNGFLTFGSGDSTYTESLGQHFSLPRVAAVFDDLNPSTGGTVSWKQLADRLAVTWEGVPEYSTSNSNTFQIEMFFDGQIRLSWLALDSGDAIAGLSEGEGLDPDFFPSDLSEGLGCGARPPFVTDRSVQTAIDTPIGITLIASDDGLPEPASLSYRIVRLPGLGTLSDDGTSTTIVAVPYDLPGGGDGVTYTPAGGALGYDSFDYTASDGGSAPDGGESDAGLVGVTVGGVQPVYEFLVDDTDPGFSVTGQWAFGTPTGGGSHNGDPSGGATGSNVYGYELSGDYVDNMSVELLTSSSMDLTGILGSTVEFQRWLGVESSTYDHASVEISTDGSSWTPVWEHTGGSLNESAWSLQSFDVSTIADGEGAVSLRWSMGTTDGSVTYPGWNIDDIRLLGLVPGPCGDPPTEVPNLTFSADRQTLSWSPASYGGGLTPAYDLLRSSDPSEFVAGVDCLEADSPGTVSIDPDTPAIGTVYFYLVRAENDCGAGSVGAGRIAGDCAP